MKVALDATAVTAEPSGARTRLVSLYTRIARSEGIDLTVIVRSGAGLAGVFETAGARVVRVAVAPSPWMRWTRMLHGPARRADGRARFDLFAAETLPLPRLRRVPMAVTVHDMRFLRARLSTPSRRLFAALFLRKNLLRARAVVMPSESMKREMEDAYPGLPPGRIEVVPNGVPPMEEVGGARADELLRKLGVQPPYILYLGHLETRKNVTALVEGFLLFRHARPENMAVAAVLAGAGVEGYDRRVEELWEERESRPGRPGLHILGAVSEEERAALLKSALLVVQPALYEGFGLGLLEAMALGIPVACSDIDSHREIAGDRGGLFFNPHSREEIAGAMERGALDHRVRGELTRTGRERAKRYSWEASAERLAEIWRRAAAKS